MAIVLSNIPKREVEIFSCEILTPMFMGGADPKQAQLRTASIKGLLRFWWRALYGTANVESMKKKENQIFGSTDQRSALSLHLSPVGNMKPRLEKISRGKTFKVKNFSLSIIDYLAYGTFEYKKGKGNVYIKQYFPAGGKFDIEFIFHRADYKDEILNAFRALVQFGGMGAKNRNGFGCLYVPGLTGTKIDVTGRQILPFTAFSENISYYRTRNAYKRWELALSEIGMLYRDARLDLEPRHSFEKRPLIAKPLEVRKEVSISGRQAKPYFLHVSRDNSGYWGWVLFLPFDHPQKDQYLAACRQMNQVFGNSLKKVV